MFTPPPLSPQKFKQAARQTALAKETANGESKTDDAAAGAEKKGGHNKRRGRSAAPPVDADPLGLTLLEKDPLPEAARLVALLSAHAGAHVETHLLAFDVAMKRGKYMLAARAVIRCVRVCVKVCVCLCTCVRGLSNILCCCGLFRVCSYAVSRRSVCRCLWV